MSIEKGNKELSVGSAISAHLVRYGMTYEETEHEFPVVGILYKNSPSVHSIVIYAVCEEVDDDLFGRLLIYTQSMDRRSILKNLESGDDTPIHGFVYFSENDVPISVRERYPDLKFFRLSTRYDGFLSVENPDVW